MIIREDQMQALRNAAQSGFESRLTRHLTQLFPRHERRLGPESLRAVVGYALRRAAELGFNTERAVCRVTELMFYFGAHFDTDPQYPWAAEYLTAHPGPGEPGRSGGLHDLGMRNWAEIAGPENRFLLDAIRRIRENPLNLIRSASVPTLGAGLPLAFERLYPEKAANIGRNGLDSLVAIGLKEAPGYGLASPAGAVLYTALMFSCGRGFAQDPILPWAGAVLRDPSLSDERTRAMRLFEQANTFMSLWAQ